MQRRKKITNYLIWMDTKLGEGAFGKVYYGQHDETKRKIAVKMLEKQKINKDQYYKNALFSEIEILKSLKSPNIVEFLDVMESNNYYYIVQQFCNGGELRKHIDRIGRLSEKQAIGFLKQICNGFVELAREGIVHRDLKPQNILINDGTLKIADFGFSKKGFQGLSNQTVVGTPLYMSLQILKAGSYTSKCDVWSLGCVFYEMLHGKTPWVANSEYELINKIQTTELSFRSDISQTTRDFIKGCLANQERDRFSWDQVFNHAIFQGGFGKPTQSVENKFKSGMNHLRYMIKTKNIDLERYFANMSFKKGSHMNYQSFRNFILYVDDRLGDDDARYIYDRIVMKTEMGLSYQDLEKVLMKFGIPMSLLKMKPEGIAYDESPRKFRGSGQQNENPMAFRQQTGLKLSNALFKLLQKLENKKMNIYEVFEAYGWNQKGYLNSSDLGKLLKLVDNSYNEKQIQISFEFLDPKNIGTVSVDGFVKFFVGATRTSFVTQKRDSNSSNSTGSNNNSLSYPVQYTNGNAMLGVLAEQINRFALNPQRVNMVRPTNQSPDITSKRKRSFNEGNGWF